MLYYLVRWLIFDMYVIFPLGWWILSILSGGDLRGGGISKGRYVWKFDPQKPVV